MYTITHPLAPSHTEAAASGTADTQSTSAAAASAAGAAGPLSQGYQLVSVAGE